MAKILITGATGFVGRSLVPALKAAGHEVRCAVTKKVDWLDAEQVLINKIELQRDWREALQGMDTVVHLAARVHVMQDKSTSPLDAYLQVNSFATKILAEQAALHKIKRFIFISSIKVNGEVTVSGKPFTEEINQQPEDPYGLSKLQGEQYVQKICANTGMEYVILRPPLVYGPGVKANFLKMLQLVKKDWPLPFAKVQNKRHFIYIDNFVSAICAVINNANAANQVYLVSDAEAFSLSQLLQNIGQGMDVQVKLLPVPVALMTYAFKLIGLNELNSRLFDSLELSTDKIQAQLGWTPPVSSKEGLGKTAKWYQHEFTS